MVRGLTSCVYRSHRKPVNRLATHDICWEDAPAKKRKHRAPKSALAKKVEKAKEKNLSFKRRMAGVQGGHTGICAQCKKSGVRELHAYCSRCGTRQLRGETSAAPLKSEVEALVAAGKCGCCHHAVLADQNFCPWCGSTLLRKSLKTGAVLRRGAEVLS